jgi:hypothetical protein
MFKKYNSGGNSLEGNHSLMRAREEFRKIVFELG